ncbi:DUF5678 domain-containing protein [Anaerolineales bacterium HSG24]|nr:DUF5678 domain-containing protein [Anaerolineales bacterium HSG24]
MMMPETQQLRNEIMATVDLLPLDGLRLLAEFMAFLRSKFKLVLQIQEGPPYSKTAVEPLQAEIEAFEQLYPTLKQQYDGQFVAIYQGQIIDSATDFESLFLRLQDRLATQHILIQQVTNSPQELYHLRSPRLEVS